MSNKLRSINTKFWEDPWIEELNPKDKLLFLYLLSNSKTNMLGIYEVSLSKISFETGLTKQEIGKAFEGFERVNKAFYIDNYVVLANFLKNQKYNTNMKKSATKEFSNLPKWLKDKLSCNDSEGFERLIKGFERLSKIEVEVEDEIEEEYKEKDIDYLYSLYPSKCPVRNASTGKASSNKKAIEKHLKSISKEELEKTIKRYISECVSSKTYLKNFGTFLNNLPDYSDNKPTQPKLNLTFPLGRFKTKEEFDQWEKSVRWGYDQRGVKLPYDEYLTNRIKIETNEGLF